MVKESVITFILAFSSVLVYAQGQMAGVCNMYEFQDEEKLPLPAGYEPWVISHYGRHGARFLTSQHLYDTVYDVFAEAESEGNLTGFGADIYDRFLSMKPFFDGRAGELTRKGREQHRRLALRMQRRFPSLFRQNPVVTAVSSTTPRCRESMEAFCSALRCRILDMASDSSDLKFLNPFHTAGASLAGADARNLSSRASWRPYWKAYCDGIIDT